MSGIVSFNDACITLSLLSHKTPDSSCDVALRLVYVKNLENLHMFGSILG